MEEDELESATPAPVYFGPVKSILWRWRHRQGAANRACSLPHVLQARQLGQRHANPVQSGHWSPGQSFFYQHDSEPDEELLFDTILGSRGATRASKSSSSNTGTSGNNVQTQLGLCAEQRFLHSEFPRAIRACELNGATATRSAFLMAFSPDARLVASTHGDHCVYVSRVSDGKCLRRLKGHPRSPWCLAFHPSLTNLLATGCLGGQVRLWQLADIDEKVDEGSKVKETHCELWQSQGVIFSLSFHPSLPLLVMATLNEVHIWDWTVSSSVKCIVTLRTLEEREKVRYVKFDGLGNALITGIANHETGGENNSRESVIPSHGFFERNTGGDTNNRDSLIPSHGFFERNVGTENNRDSAIPSHGYFDTNRNADVGLTDRFDYFSERYERALQRYNQLAENEALRLLGRNNNDEGESAAQNNGRGNNREEEDNSPAASTSTGTTRRREAGDGVSAWDEERRRTREMCLHTQDMLNSLRQRLMQQIQRYRDLGSSESSVPASTSASSSTSARSTTAQRDASTPFSHSPESEFVEVQRQQSSDPTLREHNYMQRSNESNNDINVALRVDDWALDLMRTLENATGSNSDNADNDDNGEAPVTPRGSSSTLSQPFLRRSRRLLSSSSSGLRYVDISSLRNHILHVRRICRDALAELTVGRQRRQMLRLQSILRMVQAEILQLSDVSLAAPSAAGQERTIFRNRVQRAVNRVLGGNNSNQQSSPPRNTMKRKKRKASSTFSKEVKRANTTATDGFQRLSGALTAINNAAVTSPSSDSTRSEMVMTTPAIDAREEDATSQIEATSSSQPDTRGELRALSQRLERLLKERREHLTSAENLNRPAGDDDVGSPQLPSPPATSFGNRFRHLFDHSDLSSDLDLSRPGPFTEQQIRRLEKRLDLGYEDHEEERASRRRIALARRRMNTAEANERASQLLSDWSGLRGLRIRPQRGGGPENRRSPFAGLSSDSPSFAHSSTSSASTSTADNAAPSWSDRVARERVSTSSLEDSVEQSRNSQNRLRARIAALQRQAQLTRSRVLPEHSYSQQMREESNQLAEWERLDEPSPTLSYWSHRDSQEEPQPLRDIIWRRLQRRSEQLVRLIVELEDTAAILEERLLDRGEMQQTNRTEPSASSSGTQATSSRSASTRSTVDRGSSSMFPMWPRMRSYASVAASNLNSNDVDDDLFDMEDRRQSINLRRSYFSRQDWRRGRHAADSPFYSSDPVRPGRMLGGRLPGLWPPSWWSSSSSSSSSGSVSHRIQAWPFIRTSLPDLSQRSAHLVVREARIYNEASVDVSQDGNLLVTLITCGMPIATKVGVFSLRMGTLGQCYATFTLESSAVSVSLSPTSRHLLVGLTTRHVHLVAPPLDASSPNVPMAQVYSLELPWENSRRNTSSSNVTVDRGRLIHKQDIPNTLEQHDNPFGMGSLNRTALNCIRWVPTPGQGMMFATSTGHLKFLR